MENRQLAELLGEAEESVAEQTHHFFSGAFVFASYGSTAQEDVPSYLHRPWLYQESASELQSLRDEVALLQTRMNRIDETVEVLVQQEEEKVAEWQREIGRKDREVGEGLAKLDKTLGDLDDSMAQMQNAMESLGKIRRRRQKKG